MRCLHALLFAGGLLRSSAALPQAASSIVAFDPNTDPETVDRAHNINQPAAPPQLPTPGETQGPTINPGTVNTVQVNNQSTVPIQTSASAPIVAPNPNTGSGAAKTSPPSQSPSMVAPSDPNINYDSVDRAQNEMQCILFDPPQPGPFTGCNNACGKAVAAQVAAGNMSSVSCMAFGDAAKPEKNGA